MTISEAIAHCEEVAEREKCAECAADHRQLAEWLRELHKARRVLAKVPEVLTNLCCAIGDPTGCEFCPYGKTNPGGACDVETLIKEAELCAVSPWVSVKDKLPEEDEILVFVWIEDRDIENHWGFKIAEWFKDLQQFVDNDYEPINGITHWMYTNIIPEPPKEVD